MSVLIAARDLMKAYSTRPLFEGLTFDLRAGEKVGLIGPNGAGKSTFSAFSPAARLPTAAPSRPAAGP